MKKLIVVLMVALTIASCQKKETDPGITQQEVSFAALNVTADAGLKSTNDFPNCPDDMGVPVSAQIIIDGDTYNPEVFELDGKWYTQSIKLAVDPSGSETEYEVTYFALLDANGIIMAVPSALDGNGDPAPFSEYTDPDVPFKIYVNKFAKAEVPVQVLCYQEADYDNFGFNWFEITQLVIREQCFFGDLCIKDLNDYNFGESPYLNQRTGIHHDMPAIIEVDVFKKDEDGDWVPVENSPFTNNIEFYDPGDTETWYGVGYPLCIEYPDNLMIEDEFKVVLKINVRVGPGFDYVQFAQWEFKDDEMISAGDDGVVDFVLGNCAIPDADFTFAPYMNLPKTCTLKTGGSVPGSEAIQNGIGGYFDVTLSNIPAGYEISNMGYGVNCFNRGVTIQLNKTYDMNVYSSLYPEFMQGPCADLDWDQANWLINHLDDYYPYTWYEVQQAFWYIEDNTWNFAANAGVPSGVGTQAPQMAADAIANGDGFVPLPGGWAGVAFERTSEPAVQCIFVRVDP